jgi:stress response protein YsnF
MNTQYISENEKVVNRQTRIRGLLENLRNKVHNFTVFDKQGYLVGVVHDVILDANSNLGFVVSKAQFKANEGASIIVDEKDNSFVVLSNFIKKIDESNKSFILDLEKSQIENMSEYSSSAMPNNTSNSEISLTRDVNIHDTTRNLEDLTDSSEIDEIVEEHIINLLGERVVVNSSKRKIGEIILRKEIETRMVQVPVRREKLIVEQVGEQFGSDNKQLAEIDLGQVEVAGIELSEADKNHFDSFVDNFDTGLSVSGEFDSPKIASLILNAIALEKKHGCQKVRVTVLVEDEEHKAKYQEWFARASQSKQDS